MIDLLQQYQDQYTEFARIDDFTLEDRARRVPAEKHFWVCRLIDAKKELSKLHAKKNTIKSAAEKRMIEENPVNLNQQGFKDIDKSEVVENINQKIKDMGMLIEYLERLVSCVNFIAQDIKNIVEIKKIQET